MFLFVWEFFFRCPVLWWVLEHLKLLSLINWIARFPSFSGQSVPSELSRNDLWDSKLDVGQENEREMDEKKDERGNTVACFFFFDAIVLVSASRSPACSLAVGCAADEVPASVSMFHCGSVFSERTVRLLQNAFQLSGIGEYCDCAILRKFSMSSKQRAKNPRPHAAILFNLLCAVTYNTSWVEVFTHSGFMVTFMRRSLQATANEQAWVERESSTKCFNFETSVYETLFLIQCDCECIPLI